MEKNHSYYSLKWDDNQTPEAPEYEEDDDLLINILPSYQMYQSTISRPLTYDTVDSQPPTYIPSNPQTPADVTPSLTPAILTTSTVVNTPESILSPQNSELNGYFNIPSLLPVASAEDGLSDPTTVYTRWEDSLLANTDKLKYLPKLGVKDAKKLKIEIVFTEKVGKVGHAPKIISPESIELGQSEYLYGFVMITNESDYNILFDMFSVVFEGIVSIDTDSSNKFSYRFLNMFDFNASWSDAKLDRFKSDHYDPALGSSHEVDPIDGAYFELNQHKVFLPRAKYKKFFAFKLPEKTLDHNCPHGLVKHLQVLPSTGLSSEEIISNLKRRVYHNDQSVNTDRKPNSSDLSFGDSNISYSVNARIIGRACDYSCLGFNSTSEEYVIVNQMQTFVKVRPHDHPLFQLNRKMIHQEALLLYANKVGEIEEAIQTFKSLGSTVNLQPVHSSNTELNKLKQTYFCQSADENQKRSNTYEVLTAYKSKTVFASKLVGILTLATPKEEYYIKPKTHTRIDQLTPGPSTQVNIPLKISFVFSNHGTLPHFDGISTELMVLTIKSKLPIPIVIHQDMCYENNSKPNDDFNHLVVQRFQRYAKEISEIFKVCDRRDFDISNETIRDIKCYANLKSHTVQLKVMKPKINDNETNVNDIPWIDEGSKKFSKQLNLQVDIANAVMGKHMSSNFKLLPDFQNCYMARVYAIQVNLKYGHKEKLSLKVPLVLQYPYID